MIERYSIPLTAWVLALGVGVLATMLARTLGRRFQIVDNPDGYRKVHKEPIPITGGFAILTTFIAVLVGMYQFFPNFRQSVSMSNHGMLWMGGGVAVAFGMGVFDDIFDLRPRYKLLFQVLAALMAYQSGFKVEGFTGPFGSTIELGWFSLPVTIFWFLGCMNAINLLDGLDGLAGGVGFFVSLTLALIGFIYGNLLITVLSASLCGAILAFLIFNFNPATIFLGDGGSMLIGFCIASMSLVHNNKAETTVALAIPFIALGLPVFDTAMAMLRRWSQRIPIAAGDRKHLHHVLLELGLSQRKVVIILYTICATLGGVALLLTAGRNSIAALMLVGVGTAAFFAVRCMGLLNFRELKVRVISDLQERSQSGKAGTEVEKTIHRMSGGGSLLQVWEAMGEAFDILELHHARFEMRDDAEAVRNMNWRPKSAIATDTATLIHLGGEGHEMDKWSLFLNVHAHGKSYGTLEVWRQGEEMPIRDTAMLINKLRHALGDNVHRLFETVAESGKAPKTAPQASKNESTTVTP